MQKAVRYITSATARVSDMDKRGVDAEVVFRPVTGLPAGGVDRGAICVAYNRYGKAREQAAIGAGLSSPLRDIQVSVREIDCT
jgi:hypothetical protein